MEESARSVGHERVIIEREIRGRSKPWPSSNPTGVRPIRRWSSSARQAAKRQRYCLLAWKFADPSAALYATTATDPCLPNAGGTTAALAGLRRNCGHPPPLRGARSFCVHLGCATINDRDQLVQSRSGMAHNSTEWRSFRDLATPQQGADFILEIYGPAAAEAALSCATAAQNDDRDEDYQFWAAVLACVKDGNQ